MPTRFGRKAGWIVALVLAISAAVLLVIPMRAARIAAQRSQSKNHLKQMGIAFEDYYEFHRKFPAPIRSKDGTSLLSWRVTMLPFLGEQALYREFNLDEPWDSPHNKGLLDKMPAVFVLPGSRSGPGMTFYRSFSGPGALYDPADKGAPTLASITDGTLKTLAIVEAREAVPWTRPDSEIPIDNEGTRASDALRRQIGGHFSGGANALTLAGNVHFLKETMNRRTLKSIITRNAHDLVVGDDTSDGTKADIDFELNKSLFTDIKTADRLLVYEGLPRERDENRSQATVTLQGFGFYKPPLEVPAADQDPLKALLGDERSFRELQGEEKLCGGFHPDYLAEWRVGGASYQFLICLGCEELKAFGPNHSLRCDIEPKAAEKIRKLLSKYRKNRPLPKGD
jgi:Protein of unknown function (DUF1559)